jgi:RimJ/RimL family protein N-acetyltransferase
MFIEGERIRLRPALLEDAARFVEWINDTEVRHLIGGQPYQISLGQEEEFIRSKTTNDWEHGVFVVIEATDGAEPVAIGSIELRKLEAESRKGEIGMMVGDRAFWDRGYGTEALRTFCRWAFATLDLHRLELAVMDFNPRARRAYEKVGFAVEGRRREDTYLAGRYHDSIEMGLLRREFDAREAELEVGRPAAAEVAS